jgi:hypothetical protein
VKIGVRFLLAALFGFAIAGCRDPVHDDEVDALGPEVEGVPQGPEHRPGQPCTVCHGGKGPGSPTFDLAGTVFAYPDSPAPREGALVRVVDGSGAEAAAYTNRVGTFYWTEHQLGLGFPLWVSIEYCGQRVEMKTPIFRETACASCHRGESTDSVAQVYFEKTPGELCP